MDYESTSRSAAPPASGRNSNSMRDRVMQLKLSREARNEPGIAWPRWLAAVAILGILAAVVVLQSQAKQREAAEKNALNTTPSGTGSNPSVGDATSPRGVVPANPASNEVARAGTPNPAAPPVALAEPQGKILLESKGYLVPAHQILVSPKVQGMVVKLDIEEGRRVKKGDLLAEIESIEFERDYERAKAIHDLSKAKLLELENGSRPEEVSQAEAELGQAQEELKDFERIWKRNIELWKTRSVTEQEMLSSESQVLGTRRRIERLAFALQLMRKGPREERITAARAESRQYEADMLKAAWRLSNCKILAPISGTILKKNAEEGNLVNTLAMNGSFSLCEMADLSDLEVDLAIQERDVSKIFVGQHARVRSEAYPDRIYEGYVSRLMPIADRAKGAIPVRVKVRVPTNEEGVYLKPEMGAIVSFYDYADPKKPAAVAVP
jgi:HlyD family secretion protein